MPATAARPPSRWLPASRGALDVTLHPAGTDHGWPSLGQHGTICTGWKVQVQASTALSEQLTGLLQHEQLADPQQTVGTVVTSPRRSRWRALWLRLVGSLLSLIITVLVVAYVIWRFAAVALHPAPLSGAIPPRTARCCSLRGRNRPFRKLACPPETPKMRCDCSPRREPCGAGREGGRRSSVARRADDGPFDQAHRRRPDHAGSGDGGVPTQRTDEEAKGHWGTTTRHAAGIHPAGRRE